MEVSIEVRPQRRYPLERPTHPLAIRLDLVERGIRYGNQRRIAMCEVYVDAVVVIRPERTTGAAFFPVGPEHEVIDQQLFLAAEEVRK